MYCGLDHLYTVCTWKLLYWFHTNMFLNTFYCHCQVSLARIILQLQLLTVYTFVWEMLIVCDLLVIG